MQVSSVFDSMAASYDADFTNSGIGKLQRDRVWSFLNPLLNRGSLNILEINCGTGEDALKLASAGHTVVATDASTKMIEQARTKLSKSSPLNLSFEVCPFDQLKDKFAGQQFDLIFSNFGGLNCIDASAIKQLGNDLAALTKPSGHLFLVLLGNCCLWETGYFGMRAQFKKAFRRFNGKSNFIADGQTIAVHYYAVTMLKKLMRSNFIFEQAKPVGLFIPPSYLEERFSKNPRRLQQLSKLESKFSHSALSGFADHYCAVFKNTTSRK